MDSIFQVVDGARRAGTMDMLLRIDITRDCNDAGERAYLVTPVYRLRCGRVVSVPDSRGWTTKAEAVAEAERIAGGK